MNSIAFIIPIHPPKYDYIYKLKNKINIINKCCDIILVFSNQNDYNKFLYKENFKKIIIDNSSNIPIIYYKKFYALKTLKNKYSYYITCDSEIDIIIENFNFDNIIKKINKFYNNNNIFSGEDKNFEKITEESCNIFKSKNDKNKLKILTNNYKLSYWWSDIPIYKGNHLEDFFNRIDFKLYKNQFDHIIYLNYLALYHNFNFINVTPLININRSLECLNSNDIKVLEKLKKYYYTFSWVIPSFFKKHKKISFR